MKKFVVFLFVIVLCAMSFVAKAQMLQTVSNVNETRLSTTLHESDLSPVANLVFGKKFGLAFEAQPCPEISLPSIPKAKVHLPYKKVCLNESIKTRDTIIVTNNITINDNNKELLCEFKKFESFMTDHLKDNCKSYAENHDKEMANLKLQMKAQNYRTGGWIKIVGGFISEASAVGLVAYANIPKYQEKTVVTVYEAEYHYTEYQLKEVDNTTPVVPLPTNTNSSASTTSGGIVKCNPEPIHHGGYHHNPCSPEEPPVVNNNNTTNNTYNNTTNNYYVYVNNIKYELVPIDKTGKVSITDVDQATEKVSRDKTGYYVGATVLGLLGIGLQVWGITDLCKAKNLEFTLNQDLKSLSQNSSGNIWSNTQIGLKYTFGGGKRNHRI